MADKKISTFSPEDRVAALIAAIGKNESRGMRDLDALLLEYPRDPRLHFLKGSLLAGQQDYAEARKFMRQAVDIAPDYAIARFQLGFLLLTSGESHAAQEAWGPLHGLPADNYLRLFVQGLCHLIRDEFDDTIRMLEDGIARNRENLPMNRDMQMIIDEVRKKQSAPDGGSGVSSVDFLLRQSSMKSTKH